MSSQKSYNLLGDLNFQNILPESMRDDAVIAAASKAMETLLAKVTHSIPNLLIWARLDYENAKLSPPLARLSEAAGGLKPLSLEELELLAWQLHVDFRDIAVDRAMLERMVRESIPWHRIKGTPAAVERALAMYGVTALVDESGVGDNWAVYELDLGDIPTESVLANIVRVANEAAALRSQLRRVYSGFDRRPIVLDVGPPLDDGYLDDDSGVWNEDAGVKESYGQIIRITCRQLNLRASIIALEEARYLRAFYIDRPILDQWSLDTPTVKNYGFVSGVVISLRSRGMDSVRYGWVGLWDKRKWNGSDLYDAAFYTSRRRIHNHISISKAQMVPNDSRLDDCLQTLDRQLVEVVDGGLVLDSTPLDISNRDMGLRTFYIDERFISTRALSLAQANAKSLPAASGASTAASAMLDIKAYPVALTTYREEKQGALVYRQPFTNSRGGGWVGPWSDRPWFSRQALIHHTQGA